MIHTSTTDSVKTDWSTVVVRDNLYLFCQNRQKFAKIINNEMKYILIYWRHSKLIFSFTLESNVKRMTIDVRHIQSFHTFVSLIIKSQLGSSFPTVISEDFSSHFRSIGASGLVIGSIRASQTYRTDDDFCGAIKKYRWIYFNWQNGRYLSHRVPEVKKPQSYVLEYFLVFR